MEYDLNGDGRVNHEEFRIALRNLQHPALSDYTVIADLIKILDPDGDPTAKDTSNRPQPTDNINFDKFSWDMARTDLKQVVEKRGRDMLSAFRNEATRQFEHFEGELPRDKAIDAIQKALLDTGVKAILVNILVSRAETHAREDGKGSREVGRIQEAQLSKTLREIAGDSFEKAEETTLRDSFMVMLRASKLSAMDNWRLRGEDSAELKKLWGSASLGPDALRNIGPVAFKRLHMNNFLGHGGQHMLESMAASPALVAIKNDRVATIYSKDPWISFWQLRANYRSPALPSSSSNLKTSAATSRSLSALHAMPAIHASSPPAAMSSSSVLVATASEGTRINTVWEAVRVKVRKAAFEQFQTHEEALAGLDPENAGAGAIGTQSLRQALEGIVPSLSGSELDMIIDKLDPGHDGMVLKSDIVHTLLPPGTDRISLERLAQERHARGIYSRLRDRRADPPSSLYRHAPIFDVRARHEGLSSTHQREGLSSMQQRRDAQSTGAPAVGGERVDYHYRHEWDRVQHAPAAVRPMYRSSHYIVGVSDRQAYGVDGPDDPWSASTRGVIGPNMHGANASNAPRAPTTMARMSQYTPEYSTAAGTAAQRYGDAGSAYQSGLIGQLPEHAYRNPSNVQQQFAPPTRHPSGHNTSLGDAGGELEDMYRSTMQQVTVRDMCRYICVCICGRYWWQAGRYLLLYHAVGICVECIKTCMSARIGMSVHTRVHVCV